MTLFFVSPFFFRAFSAGPGFQRSSRSRWPNYNDKWQRSTQVTARTKQTTPWKINMEPEDDSLEDNIPFQSRDFRFHVNLPGCKSLDFLGLFQLLGCMRMAWCPGKQKNIITATMVFNKNNMSNPKKTPLLLSIESWLVNRDPCSGFLKSHDFGVTPVF